MRPANPREKRFCWIVPVVVIVTPSSVPWIPFTLPQGIKTAHRTSTATNKNIAGRNKNQRRQRIRRTQPRRRGKQPPQHRKRRRIITNTEQHGSEPTDSNRHLKNGTPHTERGSHYEDKTSNRGTMYNVVSRHKWPANLF